MKTINYSYRTLVIDESNIKDFVFLKFGRRTNPNKIKGLTRLINLGQHFDVPIVVNRNSKIEVLDGQHRISAIQQAIADDPDFQIEVLIIQYENLSEEDKRKTFHRWNIGKPSSSDDFVKTYEDTIWILQEMYKNFPCKVSVYPSDDQLHFRKIISSYISSELALNKGGYGGNKEKFVEDAQKLDKSDYVKIEKFYNELSRYIPRILSKTETLGKSTSLQAICYMWFNCVEEGLITSKDFWTRFNQYVRYDENFVKLITTGGAISNRLTTGLMVELFNKAPSTLQRIPDTI